VKTFTNHTTADLRFLDAALRLARKHQGLTGTNPSVACILVNDLGHGPVIVGSGVTAPGGRPHAEPPAVEEAGAWARGSTAYVTLEPCAHHGKTPPCAQNLIDNGITRIVTAITDPDERVNGQGHAMMAKAGIEIVTVDRSSSACRVMAGYLASRGEKRPFVSLKVAMTQDGIIGSVKKGNMKISGDVANRQTHLSRARHDAILVGAGTAIADDPKLNCRLPGLANRSPVRIVLDLNSRLESSHTLVKTAGRVTTLVVGRSDAPSNWLAMLQEAGAQFLAAEIHDGHVALPELFDDLHARGIQSVMVEAGAKLSQSLLADNLVDEIILHVGGEPEALGDLADAIHAPFSPSALPDGFHVCQSLVFGADTSLRLLKG
jgi:diaminohydroxyphosphoribosylaminopyrimidine deaminase/5-amino-6-(5-phosphoribosylamino)uracil reductase